MPTTIKSQQLFSDQGLQFWLGQLTQAFTTEQYDVKCGKFWVEMSEYFFGCSFYSVTSNGSSNILFGDNKPKAGALLTSWFRQKEEFGASRLDFDCIEYLLEVARRQ